MIGKMSHSSCVCVIMLVIITTRLLRLTAFIRKREECSRVFCRILWLLNLSGVYTVKEFGVWSGGIVGVFL